MDLPQLDDYRQLFLGDVPLLDVRAPVEFQQGSFPLAQNFPLINDDEREAIGICYKQQGQNKAVELGHQLVSGNVKQQRVNRWAEFVEQYPEGVLYCFRGGMRSKITQQWIYEATGVIYPRVKGGYKAMRRFLINELDAAIDQLPFVLLSGRTGSGKTGFLHRFNQQIDLEGIFHHRGSAFGGLVTPQPSQIDIENALSIDFLRLRDKQVETVLLEDESGSIGSRRIPEEMIHKMRNSPVVILEVPREQRIELIYQQYIIDSRKGYQQLHGEEAGARIWAQSLQNALLKIQRRLGGDRFSHVASLMTSALSDPTLEATAQHQAWIAYLLDEYYDPMYDYQLTKKADHVIFRGNDNDVVQFLRSQNIR